jgi:hypothetical protein
MVSTTQTARSRGQAATQDPGTNSDPAAHHLGGHPNSDAAEHAVQTTSAHLHLTVGDTRVDVTAPPLDKIAFYIGLTCAAAFGLIEWPMAALTGIGHLLSDDRGNRAMRALGEALDAA